jgi:hypothetical protein
VAVWIQKPEILAGRPLEWTPRFSDVCCLGPGVIEYTERVMHLRRGAGRVWVAHTSRVLATVFHRRGLCWTLELRKNHGEKEKFVALEQLRQRALQRFRLEQQ